MDAINLIPAHQLQARRARRRARRWVAFGAAYAVACVLAVLAMRVAPGHAHTGHQRTVARLEREVTSSREQLTEAVDASRAVARHLRVANLSAQRADWSRLLALVAREAEGLAVLERLTVRRDDGDGRPLVMVLDGLARDAAAPSRLALRLEETGVMRDVDVGGTSRRRLDDRRAISFSLRCVLERAPRGDERPQSEGGA